jgi:hypothetical protein
MSTTIYRGLKANIPYDSDIFGLFTTIDSIITNEHARLRNRLLYETIRDLIDFGMDDVQKTYRPTARLVRVALDAMKQSISDGTNDLSCRIMLGRTQDHWLAYPMSIMPEYDAALIDSGLFSSYGYWDSADRPLGMTEDEWSKRSKEWDALIRPEGYFTALPTYVLQNANDVSYDVDNWFHDYYSDRRNTDQHERKVRVLTGMILDRTHQSHLNSRLSDSIEQYLNDHDLPMRPMPDYHAHLEDLPPATINEPAYLSSVDTILKES